MQDQSLLMMAMTDYVEQAGCLPVEATTATEAMRILEARSDIRIVFCDLDLRGAPGGLALAQAIRRRWPSLELLLTSAQARARREDMPERGVYVAKPFDRRRVLGALLKLAA